VEYERGDMAAYPRLSHVTVGAEEVIAEDLLKIPVVTITSVTMLYFQR